MIVRIVKMKFAEEKVNDFKSLFWETRSGILQFDGCKDVKLMQSETDPQIIATYSLWENSASLDKYRFSEFFKNTWKTIKPWMIEKADAISYLEVKK